jgi:hypothetical protein
VSVDSLPIITVPSDIELPYDTPSGRVVTYDASASDSNGGRLVPDCSPVSGSLFPIQETTVTCYVTDSNGKRASKSFRVTILDGVAPILKLPGNLTESAPAGAVTHQVSFEATAVDAIDGQVPVTCSPPSGSAFPVTGKPTTVSCSATDAAGNSAPGSFEVSVFVNIP